ncbi:hypothetical protein JTB14_019073 [Gonioctena quinquepunctata]|nr:hypothetical protein JTB14_019073 [Gonioctena quinquepunctata]
MSTDTLTSVNMQKSVNPMPTIYRTAPRRGAKNDDDEEDFFNSVMQSIEKPKSSNSLKSKAQSLVKMWLDMKSKDSFNDAAFLGEQIFINLFIKYNTYTLKCCS